MDVSACVILNPLRLPASAFKSLKREREYTVFSFPGPGCRQVKAILLHDTSIPDTIISHAGCQGQRQMECTLVSEKKKKTGFQSRRLERLPPRSICQSSKAPSHVTTNIIFPSSLEKQAPVGNTIPLRNSPETDKQVWLVLHARLTGRASLWRQKAGGPIIRFTSG